MSVKINFKKYVFYSLLSLLSFVSLVLITKLDKTNGMPILQLVKSISPDKIINNIGTDIRKVFIIEIISEFKKFFISLGFVFIENQNEIHDNSKSINIDNL